MGLGYKEGLASHGGQTTETTGGHCSHPQLMLMLLLLLLLPVMPNRPE